MDKEVNIRSLAWVAAALSGAGRGLLVADGIQGYGEREWFGAAVDSRSECSGRLFFAIRGENTDGHGFITDAYASGAVAAIIEDASKSDELEKQGIPYLLVASCLDALQTLAREYRELLPVRVIAITGSAGKTTTKEYVGQIMKSKYRAFANRGNLNSLIGVPLTVLETEIHNEYLICEIGANHTGEVGFLAALLRPDVGVITNVGDAHVGIFGSVDAVADAKAELLDHLGPKGYAVLPVDDAYFEKFKQKTTARVVTFGGSADADFTLSGVGQHGTSLTFEINGEAAKINAVGEYNALNACAAYAVGDICGVEHARICEALASAVPMSGRGRVQNAGGVTVIDESYNASPGSMDKSLRMLTQQKASRRFAVLGDMKELGQYRDELHRRLGERLAASNVDGVFWLGDAGRTVKEAYTQAGGTAPFRLYESLVLLGEDAGEHFRPGDTVLIKASRACNLDRFATSLLEKLDSDSEN